MRTKAPAPRSTRSPSKTAGPGWLDQRHRAPASPRAGAIQPDRLCDDRQAQSLHRRAPTPRSGVGALSPLPLPLTFCAMNGSRRHRRSSARPALVLLSVLALLASACFPMAVHAATVYDPESTTIPGEVKPEHQKPKNNSSEEEARASDSGSPAGSGGSGNGSSGNGSSADRKSASTGGGEGTGQVSPGNGSPSAHNSPADPAGTAGTGATADDGGSSPLVPILIAIAVLAAISVGAVVARKRRQQRGLGDPISPKAS